MPNTPTFTYRILIQPLGLLYGSKGRFLSPENLVGRSGSHFPPDTPTLSGLFAAQYQGDRHILDSLMLAGPFWAYRWQSDNFYVPTPLHCWAWGGSVQHLSSWQGDRWLPYPDIDQTSYKKRQYDTWITLADWSQVRSLAAFKAALDAKQSIPVADEPWKPLPHLHPRLRSSERRSVGSDDERGSLFLEYGIQLDPEVCLVYLSNVELPEGCYRFGGEGHIAQVTSEKIEPDEPIRALLDTPEALDRSFAIACPGVWGSNRLSYRAPCRSPQGQLSWPDNPVQSILTKRPQAFRFRLGNQHDEHGQDIHGQSQPKLLSRGRYAVPAGSVYMLENSLAPWLKWPDGKREEGGWFPHEGYSFKRWGCSLAFPLSLVSS
ncbi:MAG: CRISPR-associated protein Cmr3 [Leptolyngbya sp. SIO4C5]|nr:CRISPR-associated protein Cmr3 [Leptolyngbya sp. SIO4C5]